MLLYIVGLAPALLCMAYHFAYVRPIKMKLNESQKSSKKDLESFMALLDDVITQERDYTNGEMRRIQEIIKDASSKLEHAFNTQAELASVQNATSQTISDTVSPSHPNNALSQLANDTNKVLSTLSQINKQHSTFTSQNDRQLNLLSAKLRDYGELIAKATRKYAKSAASINDLSRSEAAKDEGTEINRLRKQHAIATETITRIANCISDIKIDVEESREQSRRHASQLAKADQANMTLSNKVNQRLRHIQESLGNDAERIQKVTNAVMDNTSIFVQCLQFEDIVRQATEQVVHSQDALQSELRQYTSDLESVNSCLASASKSLVAVKEKQKSRKLYVKTQTCMNNHDIQLF